MPHLNLNKQKIYPVLNGDEIAEKVQRDYVRSYLTQLTERLTTHVHKGEFEEAQEVVEREIDRGTLEIPN